MTDYSLSPVCNVDVRTVSHHDEIFDGPAATPYRLTWPDIHGASLAAEFKAALRKLEGLLYVIWGGQPDYAGELQWDEVENPRCRWGPEQWWQQRQDDPPYNIFWNYLETAALGQMYAGSAGCSVPVRSRSGDPAAQFARSAHSVYFPRGSVERYCDTPGSTGHQVHDPASTYQKFAAWPASEDVVIRYTRPAALGETVVSAAVVTSLGTYPMTNTTGEIWEATIPAQTQSTWVDWYVRVVFSGSANYRYDPFIAIDGDMETAPTLAGRVSDPEHGRAANAAYAYDQYSHYNPFAGGLPELLDETEPHLTSGLRRGTDEYRFDSSENIQPGLINLVRFTLDYIGLRFHHHPTQRGATDRCCVPMPIRWRWTGGNRPNLYRAGGKGGTNGTTPLNNHPEESDAGDHEARKTWRGVDYVWHDDGYYENWYYGGNESWLSRPEQLLAEYDADSDSWPVRRPYGGRGLQAGDAIDPVHIRELIDAIDYLISNGLWTTADSYSTPKTLAQAWGRTCGDTSWSVDTCEGHDDYPDHQDCAECCASCPGGVCVPHAKPTWEDCVGEHGRCHMVLYRDHYCDSDNPCGGSPCWFSWDLVSLSCDANAWFPGGTIYDDLNAHGAKVWSASHHICGDCLDDPPNAPYDMYGTQDYRWIFGSSYYLCGPVQCPGGPDSNHGNGIVKARFAQDGSPVGTGPSMGNCFGEIESCTELAPGETIEVDFEEVSGVLNLGFANHWFDAQLCNVGEWMEYEHLAVAGLGIYTYDKTDYLTSVSNYDGNPCTYLNYQEFINGLSGNVSTANWPVCMGNAVWVAIDLNVDGNGVPRLRDYDLEIEDPWDECPCATWTGPGACG